MLKTNIIISYCSINLLFLGSTGLLYASNEVDSNQSACIINLNQMPQYQASFTFPLQENSAAMMDEPEQSMKMKSLVLRFYQHWGNGDATGWQTPINPPKVTLDGKELEGAISFSYLTANYIQGSAGLGMDQYAQYFTVNLADEEIHLGSELIIEGTFEQVAYVSAVVYSQYGSMEQSYNRQAQILDKDMKVLNNACNPYIKGNSSVFAYPANIQQSQAPQLDQSKSSLENIESLSYVPKVFNDNESGKVGVYRLDQETSKKVVADDIAADGCSRAYLFGKMGTEQKVAILRIKVPTTFLGEGEPDEIFAKEKNYQARYFSVGAHRQMAAPDEAKPLLKYWTVNARMLNEYKDKDGYAYVFFAPNGYPNDYPNEYPLEQSTSETQPPVITWGKYKGYLLGEPDYAIIIRYRDPDISWKGSPENATCYENSDVLQPIGDKELGKDAPEIFAGTLDNFFNGNIGAVNMGGPWPKNK